MTLTIFFGILIVLLFLGMPVAMSFFISSLSYLLMNGGNLQILLKQMVSGTNSFIYLAVPLFMLSAQIMNETKITNRLFGFCDKLVGHLPGGLGHVNIVSSIIFSGMSGSAIADTSGIGFLAYKAMVDKGFPKPFSAALTISSATVGPIIPPSIIMVIYAVLAGASVGQLFIGGVVPGLIIGLFLMVYCYIVAKKNHYPIEQKSTIREFGRATLKAIPSLMMPVILLGGIYTGIFTPTEAAGVAAFYVLIVGFFYRENNFFNTLKKAGVETLRMTGMTMFIIATASVFSWVITRENIPQAIANWIIGANISKETFLLLVNVILLVMGCLFDANTLLLVFIPLVLPVANLLNVNLVHFGVVVTLNLMIGMATPPFGMQLFLVSGITKIKINDILKAIWPQLICLVAVLLLITFIEPLVMWLPSLMK